MSGVVWGVRINTHSRQAFHEISNGPKPWEGGQKCMSGLCLGYHFSKKMRNRHSMESFFLYMCVCAPGYAHSIFRAAGINDFWMFCVWHWLLYSIFFWSTTLIDSHWQSDPKTIKVCGMSKRMFRGIVQDIMKIVWYWVCINNLLLWKLDRWANQK